MKELIELGEKQGYFLDGNGWFRNEYWITYQGRSFMVEKECKIGDYKIISCFGFRPNEKSWSIHNISYECFLNTLPKPCRYDNDIDLNSLCSNVKIKVEEMFIRKNYNYLFCNKCNQFRRKICEKCDHCRSLEMYKEAVKSK